MSKLKDKQSVKTQFLKLLENLKPLKLPKDQYIIWGSGVLAIRNIRKANDLDIIVSKHCWNNLLKKYSAEGSKLNLIKIDQMIIDKDIIEGYPFMKLNYTIKWKKFLNRQKDLEDVLIIENFLSKESRKIER